MKYLFTVVLAVVVTATFGKGLTVDVEKSTAKWTGKKVTGEHFGNVSIKSGNLELNDGKIMGGEFVLDMNSITNIDLEGEWADKLIGHLKSDDFFGVDKYPLATLKIVESGAFVNGEAEVSGHLTIKGITEPISFTVKKQDGGFSSTLVVDRTKYGAKFRSGKFFQDLGDKLIYDDFTVEVNLVTL